ARRLRQGPKASDAIIPWFRGLSTRMLRLTASGEITDNEAVQPPDRASYLERLIMGLEQTIENLKFEIPYYKDGDLQLVYAKKFLKATEENLVKAQKELEDLKKAEKPGK